MSIRDDISELYGEELLFLHEPEYDEAIAGVTYRADGTYSVCYDADAVVKVLERTMSHDEAVEWYGFNIERAYVGPNSPTFLYKWWGTGQ